MIKISVIIPVYNVEAFLSKCVDSVLNQSYKNIEIIIVNDETPDNSQKIIDKYCSFDNRVISIIHEKNKGLGGARNTGVSVATGEYIAFLDSDDWIVNTAIEDLVNEIKLNNSDIIKFGRVESYPDYENTWLPTYKNKICSDGWEDIKYNVKINKFNPICWTSIYKRSLIVNNSIFFPEKLLFEDFYFTVQTHVLATKISYINKALYFWRKEREGSITYTVNNRDVEVCKSLKLVNDFLIKHKREDIIHSSYYHLLIYTWSAGTTIYRYLKTKTDKQKKQRIIKYLAEDNYFRKSIEKVALSKDINLNMRISAFLLRKNITIFKLFYKLFLFFKKP